MNRNPQTRFQPSSPLLRTAFAAVALVATVGTAGFIGLLAQGHGTPSAVSVQLEPVFVIAHR